MFAQLTDELLELTATSKGPPSLALRHRPLELQLLLLLLRLQPVRRLNAGVPSRPLLAPWYRLVGEGDRILLEHARSVVAFEGAAVRVLLPALLPLLDGSRTIESLVERLGDAARPAVEAALRLLAAHDLLVEGPDVTVADRPTVHAAAAAFGLPPAEAAERLAGARAGVLGTSDAAEAVARLLHAGGIRDVRRLSWRRAKEIDLAVVAPGPDEGDAVPGWNLVALEAGLPWLPVRPFDGLVSLVGPLVVPGESSCHECLMRRLGANVEYGAEHRDLELAPVAARPDAAFAALVAGLAAHLAFRWIVGRDRTLPGTLYAVEQVPRITVTTHTVLRVPRCPVCSSASALPAPLPWHEAAAA